ncbi:hypothetical protein BY458DRAFT_257597 [Sporodiniella umbellata]|nr:hypothetical protein BY458DRAFT_257597 [Sporodiniella umbellata]
MTVEKPTVVDEFFSALFSHPKSDKNSSQANKKRSLDEYDEYAMLTKRKLDGSSRPMIRLKKSKDTQEDIYLGSKMRMRNVSTAMHWKDIRDRFSKFGKIIDIVFKHPFVFVQFETVEACTSAVENEQGKPWRGSTLELEVCRYRPCFSAEPQKPKAPKLDNSKITKLLVRSHVTRSFVSVLSSDFEKSGVLLDTVYVKNPKSERELIKTFVKNGIKTVVTIDRNLEQNERVSLRLFSSEDNGKSASFDRKFYKRLE